MNPASVFFGLASAFCWGAGDFCGGFASKQQSSYFVVLVSQIVGGCLFVVLALATAEPLAGGADLVNGAAAGLFGMMGLLALYTGLAAGRMSVFAPLAAIISLAPPAAVALVTEGWPPLTTVLGFLLAVPAVWLLSASSSALQRLQASDVRLAMIAGLGFGLFFIFIDRVSAGAVFWPLAIARAAAILALTLYLLVKVRGLGKQGPRAALTRSVAGAIFLSGAFDAGGNAFFTLATQSGRLDVAAVLSSLYPAATALLAWGLLKERLTQTQWAGMVTALVALVMIAV